MRSEWRRFVFEDLAADSAYAMSTGPFGSAISSKFFEPEGIPVIRGKNLSTDVGVKMSDDGLVFVSLEKSKEFQRSVVRPGDLVFTCWGTINQVGLVADKFKYPEYIISNKQMKFTANMDLVDPLYLYYLFSGPVKQAEILQNGIGAAVPGFNLGQLKKHVVCIPCLEVQRRISNFLTSFDDKIELNRQMNETLEAMAQALFKSWFVDFDPVIDNALAVGNEIPESLQAKAAARQAQAAQHNAPEPLPDHVRQQFPNAFEYSETMGWVPEGWGILALGELTTELRRGISPKYIEEGGVRVVNQKCIRAHFVNYSLARRNDVTQRKVEGKLLEVGDLLVNSTGVGTLGRMAQVYFLDEPTVVDSHVTVLRADANKYRAFTFARMMLSIEPLIEAMGEGSTGQTELSRANLAAYRVIVPSLSIQDIAEQNFIDLAKQATSNIRLTDILIKLRDTLLPRLLSGELRIPDAENLIKEAV